MDYIFPVVLKTYTRYLKFGTVLRIALSYAFTISLVSVLGLFFWKFLNLILSLLVFITQNVCIRVDQISLIHDRCVLLLNRHIMCLATEKKHTRLNTLDLRYFPRTVRYFLIIYASILVCLFKHTVFLAVLKSPICLALLVKIV